MDQHRLGTCSSCEARYRVPASFKADKAKCKKCGGVVKIGPVVDASASKPAPAKQPRAARPSQAGKAEKSSRPARASAAKPKRPPAAAAAPAANEKTGASVRSATEDAAERVRSSGGKSTSSRSGSRRKGRTTKKKESKVGLILGLVALLLLAGGGGWFLMNKDKSVEAQAPENMAAAEDSEAETTDTKPADASAPASTGGADDAAPEALATESTESEPEPAVEEQAKPEPAKAEVIDLAALEDFGPAPGTSDEDWTEIQVLVATSIDPNAGARGNRAANALHEKGRLAFPAVLNTLKTLDFSTQDGYRNGDVLQKLLERICNGNNFGWKYSTDEADVTFNTKVVDKWFWTWGQVIGEGADGSMWINIAKLDEEQAAAYRVEIGLETESGGPAASEVGSADELDDF